ncbi:RNA-binding domain superfamily [Sesbania bispinosa]|nr:RNA-binding domain superfamily [Sesbania bispinosa]
MHLITPELVYQFYTDASTMVRIYGRFRDTATSMPVISILFPSSPSLLLFVETNPSLVMSLRFTKIVINKVQSLESWNGGVLVMASGSLQLKDYNVRKEFMQTFFLAPQEKGFFVLSDILHFVEEEPVHHHPAVFLPQSNLGSKLNAPSTINQPASNPVGGDTQAREFVAENEVKENGVVDNHGFSEQQMQQVHDAEHIEEDVVAEASHGSIQPTVDAAQDHAPTSAEEPPEEPQKHTYASILRVAKGQSTPPVASQPSQMNASSLELDHAPATSTQETTASTSAFERSETDAAEEVPTAEDDDYFYVRNLSPSVSASEIEEEFKNFGKIRPDGVVIRSRKDLGVCFAFVEFEDMTGAHSALKAGSLEVAGRQVYIEERRPYSSIHIPSRGGRGRGRGRGFGSRKFGRGNGFYRPIPRHQVPRNLSES